jgi:regulation of enolase protein 1 (concanavalin A-like superfamily)|tara:strand:+ start:1081 stop:1266 length:186 start_codon:yes stop_codon:yes gene_type:complete
MSPHRSFWRNNFYGHWRINPTFTFINSDILSVNTRILIMDIIIFAICGTTTYTCHKTQKEK